MKNLNVIIAGATGTGKTHITLLLEKFLKDYGYNVDVELTDEILEYGSEEKMRHIFAKDFEHRNDALSETLNIKIIQKQVKS